MRTSLVRSPKRFGIDGAPTTAQSGDDVLRRCEIQTVAHDLSDAEQAAPVGEVSLVPGMGAVGEPAIPERGIGGLAPANEPPWGASAPVPPKVQPALPKRRRHRDPHATRRPIIGLTALILTTLVATFFGWVSTEPFWLALGRGMDGTVTVTSCRPGGLDERCVGKFSADRFTSETVRLSGVPEGSRERGARFQARMLDEQSRWAYAGPVSGLHLRWQLGAVAVLLCGVLIGLVTGVGRLRSAGRGGRFLLRLLGIAGPLAIFGGMLAAALI